MKVYICVYLGMHVCMCVGVFRYVCTCIYMYIVYIYIFPYLSLNGAVGTIIHCGERNPRLLRDYQICLKKMVFMFSYPKSTEEVMVVRNKWNFDPNLWFSVASVGVISFRVTTGGYTPARHLLGGSQASFLAGTISEHIKGQGQLPKAGVLFPLRTEWHLQPLLP